MRSPKSQLRPPQGRQTRPHRQGDVQRPGSPHRQRSRRPSDVCNGDSQRQRLPAGRIGNRRAQHGFRHDVDGLTGQLLDSSPESRHRQKALRPVDVKTDEQVDIAARYILTPDHGTEDADIPSPVGSRQSQNRLPVGTQGGDPRRGCGDWDPRFGAHHQRPTATGQNPLQRIHSRGDRPGFIARDGRLGSPGEGSQFRLREMSGTTAFANDRASIHSPRLYLYRHATWRPGCLPSDVDQRRPCDTPQFSALSRRSAITEWDVVSV